MEGMLQQDDSCGSGTVVIRSPKERSSSAYVEDTAANLAKAKAALEGGRMKRGNVKERSAAGKCRDSAENGNREHEAKLPSDSSRLLKENYDAPKALSKPYQASDDEESAKILLKSAPLSALIIPSLKEVMIDDPENAYVQSVISSFVNLERVKTGSCELMISKMIQKLASSEDASLKDLQDQATQMFLRGKESEKSIAEAESCKNQHNKELDSNSNTSSLARFLLSRWHEHTSWDL